VRGGPGTDDPGQITVINRTLRNIIIDAYGITSYQIEHPEWVGENRYDIVAKVPSGTSPEQAEAMMRNLLAERFELQIRREMRVMPIYALVVAKEGLKMKPTAEVESPGASEGSRIPNASKAGGDVLPQNAPGAQGIVQSNMADGRAKVVGQRQSLSGVVSWLRAIAVDRPIIDQTGLKGEYDFSLMWSPDPDSNLLDFSVIMQRQMGLRLEPRNMPMDILIVTSALKVPISN
jgi:uncharacterized protein (TIGR03435 family)